MVDVGRLSSAEGKPRVFTVHAKKSHPSFFTSKETQQLRFSPDRSEQNGTFESVMNDMSQSELQFTIALLAD